MVIRRGLLEEQSGAAASAVVTVFIITICENAPFQTKSWKWHRKHASSPKVPSFVRQLRAAVLQSTYKNT